YGEEDRQRLHAPEWIAQPVPFLSLAEHHLPRDHDDDQQRQADRVKAERPALQLRTLPREIVRVPELGITGGKCQETNGYVDKEHPAPRIAARDPTAERRTDDRRHQGGEAEQRHRYALLLGREGVQQHPLATRLKTAAREALQHAEQDQLAE